MSTEREKKLNTIRAMAEWGQWLAGFNGEEGEITRKGRVLMGTAVRSIPEFCADTHYYGKFRVEATPDEVQIYIEVKRPVVLREVATL